MRQQLRQQDEAVRALKDELATSQQEQQQSAEVSVLHVKLLVSCELSVSLYYSSADYIEEPLSTEGAPLSSCIKRNHTVCSHLQDGSNSVVHHRCARS